MGTLIDALGGKLGIRLTSVSVLVARPSPATCRTGQLLAQLG